MWRDGVRVYEGDTVELQVPYSQRLADPEVIIKLG